MVYYKATALLLLILHGNLYGSILSKPDGLASRSAVGDYNDVRLLKKSKQAKIEKKKAKKMKSDKKAKNKNPSPSSSPTSSPTSSPSSSPTSSLFPSENPSDQPSKSWTQLGLDIDGEECDEVGGSKGVSLSADGTTLALSFYNEGYDSYVRVYEWNEDSSQPSWLQLGSDIFGEDEWDDFGNSVSLNDNGTILAVGALFNNNDNGYDSGHVRVYEWNEDSSPPSWLQLGSDIDGDAEFDFSGASVSLSGDGSLLAVGAKGYVRVYEWNEDSSPPSWSQLGSDIDGEGFSVGSLLDSVELSSDGSVLFVEFYSDSDYYGQVYEWNEDSSPPSWLQLGSDVDSNRLDSFSLSGDGSVLAIGGPISGGVRVYEWNEDSSPPSWLQLGSDIVGKVGVERDFFVYSLSLSGDGSLLAVGAPENQGPGYVRVYEWNKDSSPPSWLQLGSDIDGEEEGDWSGSSVSLSGDGSVLAVGASENGGDNDIDYAGHVRVYEWG